MAWWIFMVGNGLDGASTKKRSTDADRERPRQRRFAYKKYLDILTGDDE